MWPFDSRGPREGQIAKECDVQYWDQRLYERLFGAESESQRIFGHHFSCQLAERNTTIRHGGQSLHVYLGHICISLSETEYCRVIVGIQFETPDSYFDVPMNEVSFGHMSFGWRTRQDGRVQPSLDLRVKDTAGIADQVSRAFAEANGAAAGVMKVAWSAKLTAMIGQSAAKVWGDWLKDDPRDEDGRLVPSKFPGQHAFALESIEFKAQI
jgi:hypothetical protein